MRFWRRFFVPNHNNNYRALLITNKALAIYLAVFIGLNMLSPLTAPNKVYALFSAQEIINQHNQQRRKYGLSQLQPSYILTKSATAKGQAMLSSNCWSHYCPNGTSPWKYFREAGYNYIYAGENLAEGFSNADAMMQAWMNSKTHRENLLKPEYTEIGVGIIVGNYQGIKNNAIVVVHFGKPAVASTQTSSSGQSSSTQGVKTGMSAPEITQPKEKVTIPDATPKISGKYDAALEVTVGTQRSGRISPQGGIFTYEPKDRLNDGPQVASAKDVKNGNKKDDVGFVIDTIPPIIDNATLQIYEVETNEENTEYSFGITAYEDLESALAVIGEQRIEANSTDKKNWTFNVLVAKDSELSSAGDNLQIIMTDLAGNQAKKDISSRELQESQILEVSPASGELSEPKGILSASIQRFRDMSNTQVFSLIFALVLLIIFALDYYIARKNNYLPLRGLRSKSHLHIGALAILVIIIIMGNLSGTI